MSESKAFKIYSKLPVWAQNMACRRKGRTLLKTRYGRGFAALLQELNEMQWWEYQKLREYQDAKLRNLIQHAYETVPYYNRIMKERGLLPKDIQTQNDLQKLPFLTKDIVRQEGENMISKGFDLRQATFSHTSGTTGAGLTFWVSNYAINFQWAVWWRHRGRFGVELCQPHANFSGHHVVPLKQNRPPFWRENTPLKQTYFSLYHMKDSYLDAYVEFLEKKDFAYYAGHPSGIYVLADYLRKVGHKLTRPPKIIITGAESLLPFQKKAFEDWIGAPATDQYGQAEGIANFSRCQEDVFHEDMEFSITELLPLQNLVEKEQGYEIVGTGLHNYAQPFIRYKTGDSGTVGHSSCSCGRHTPVVLSIDGRIESYIQTPDGRKLGRVSRAFRDILNIRESQVIQEALDSVRVKVVPAAGYSQATENEIIKEMRKLIGEGMRIEIEQVKEIPRDKSGKFRFVISQL